MKIHFVILTLIFNLSLSSNLFAKSTDGSVVTTIDLSEMIRKILKDKPVGNYRFTFPTKKLQFKQAGGMPECERHCWKETECLRTADDPPQVFCQKVEVCGKFCK